MKIKNLLLLSLLAVLTIGMNDSFAKIEGLKSIRPGINRVETVYSKNLIHLYIHGFGFKNVKSVTLDSKKVLSISSTSQNLITVTLPVDLKAGSYLLQVKTKRFLVTMKRNIRITLGAVGPQGPQGDRGNQGSQGNQGETGNTGEIGPRGPQGTQGEAGITPIEIENLMLKMEELRAENEILKEGLKAWRLKLNELTENEDFPEL
jgi:hypothetical protein